MRPRRGKRTPSPPSLAWAKWIEALGSESGAPAEETSSNETSLDEEVSLDEDFSPDEEAEAEVRLRVATEAAPSTGVRQGPAERPSPARLRVPARHAPEADVRPLTTPRPARPPAPAAEPAVPDAPPPFLAPAELAQPSHPVHPAPPAPPTWPAPFEPTGPTTPIADEPLPVVYGEDRITLLCKDPYWLHAYWEITPSNLERALEMLAGASAMPALRVHHYSAPGAETPEGSFDTGVSEWPTGHQYVHCGRPDSTFEVEIGLKSEDGRFVVLARSNRVTTPRDRVSDVVDEEWTTIPGAPDPWAVLPSGYRPGGDSLELRALARGREEIMSSAGVSSFGGSAAFARAGEAKRGFWFVIGTELIVYGATEPDATVTCQGRPVTLRSDGTFTLRFALPDGGQTFPCTAISLDRANAITITTHVERSTHRDEEVDRRNGDEAGLESKPESKLESNLETNAEAASRAQ
jgi:hypothetical protein